MGDAHENENAAFIAMALGIVARANRVTQTAVLAGLSREQL
jgi:probable addiction module antidote protein